ARPDRTPALVRGRHDPGQRHGVERGPRARAFVPGRAARAGDDRRRARDDAVHVGGRHDRDRGARRRVARRLRPYRTTRGESAMILYDYWRSSSAWRVRIALHYKAIPFERRVVNLVKDGGGEQHGDVFGALNPSRQVPVLIPGAARP